MRQDVFEFLPQFKLTIVGNHKPVLRNVDEAARRRFLIVPFEQKPALPDRELEGKLSAEASGILQWMIEGCLDWQKHGLVSPPASSPQQRNISAIRICSSIGCRKNVGANLTTGIYSARVANSSVLEGICIRSRPPVRNAPILRRQDGSTWLQVHSRPQKSAFRRCAGEAEGDLP